MPKQQNAFNLWILTEHRDGAFTADTFGLIHEARRLTEDGKVFLTAVVMGPNVPLNPETLGDYGVDRVLFFESDTPYHGELYSLALFRAMEKDLPQGLLAAQSVKGLDLCARLGGLLKTAVATHAMDLEVDLQKGWTVTRPVANGYLFEKVLLNKDYPAIVTFVPSVLTPAEKIRKTSAEVTRFPLEELSNSPQTEVLEVIEADPETLDIEEADIIVAGGRGMGTGEAFNGIHELAKVLGASVGGTRPVIDRHLLSYDRQIGQTGKTVSPRLLFNCGISGANEYTAGIEASHLVIAVNTDKRARIFRFADLGIVADVHELLPLLIKAIREMKDAS